MWVITDGLSRIKHFSTGCFKIWFSLWFSLPEKTIGVNTAYQAAYHASQRERNTPLLLLSNRDHQRNKTCTRLSLDNATGERVTYWDEMLSTRIDWAHDFNWSVRLLNNTKVTTHVPFRLGNVKKERYLSSCAYERGRNRDNSLSNSSQKQD